MKESYLYAEVRTMTLRINDLNLTPFPITRKNLHSINDQVYDLIQLNVYEAKKELDELKSMLIEYEKVRK